MKSLEEYPDVKYMPDLGAKDPNEYLLEWVRQAINAKWTTHLTSTVSTRELADGTREQWLCSVNITIDIPDAPGSKCLDGKQA